MNVHLSKKSHNGQLGKGAYIQDYGNREGTSELNSAETKCGVF